MKRKAAFYAGMGLSAFFLVYAAAKLDFKKAFETLGQIHPAWVVPFAALFFAVLYLRAVRLWYITEPVKEVSTRNLFSSICIGFMGNMIFPMRAGELIRVYVVARREAMAASGVFATVVVERMFDVFFTVLLVVAAVFMADHEGVSDGAWEKMKWAATVLAAGAACAGALLYYLSHGGGRAEAGLLSVVRRFPPVAAERLEGLFVSFQGGLMVLRNERHLFLVTLISFILYFGSILTSLFVFPIFGLPLSFEMAVVLTAFSIVGVAVPSSPGAVGTYHAGVVFALTLYGVDANVGLGVAIFMHAFMFSALVLSGLYFVWRDGFGWRELRHSADR